MVSATGCALDIPSAYSKTLMIKEWTTHAKIAACAWKHKMRQTCHAQYVVPAVLYYLHLVELLDKCRTKHTMSVIVAGTKVPVPTFATQERTQYVKTAMNGM
jgi:hypothetical protein